MTDMTSINDEINRIYKLYDQQEKYTEMILNGVRSIKSKGTLKANYRDLSRWVEQLDLIIEELEKLKC